MIASALREWLAAIPHKLVHLFDADGLAVRTKLAPKCTTAEAKENFARAQTQRLILREERTFMEAIEGTFNPGFKKGA